MAISLEPDIKSPHMAFPTVHVDMVKGLAIPKGLFFFFFLSDNTLAIILQLKKKKIKMNSTLPTY